MAVFTPTVPKLDLWKHASNFAFISGTANKPLAEKIVAELSSTFGTKLKLEDGVVDWYKNTDPRIFMDNSLRGKTVFIITTAGTVYDDSGNMLSVNDHFVQLLALVDMVRRASAASIRIVTPLSFYSRQDKKDISRVPITASLMSLFDSYQHCAVSQLITLDLHARQLQGILRIPVENIYAIGVLSDVINAEILATGVSPEDYMLVAPDGGAAKLAIAWSKRTELDYVTCEKKRNPRGSSGDAEGNIETHKLYGDTEDVAGKTCIIVDDMVDTGGTMAGLITSLGNMGAKSVWIVVSHGIFSDPASDRLYNVMPESGNDGAILERIYCTDSVNHQKHFDKPFWDITRVVSIAGQMAEVIIRSITSDSISEYNREG